jgi:hypothetical protein
MPLSQDSRAPYHFAPVISARSRGALMGDSITADAFSSNATTANWTEWGFGAWLRRFLLGRIDLPGSRVFATGGYTIAQVRDVWLPQCLAAAPDWVVVHVGKNSLGSDTPANLAAQLKTIYDSLRLAGIFVVAIPIRCCNSPNSFTGVPLLQQGYLNNWIKNYWRTYSGGVFIDINYNYLDFSTGNAQAIYLRDGIHDNVTSAILMGQTLANVINGLVPAMDDRFSLLGDVYDATNNLSGNLLTNGLMAGSGGTILNGATGTPPTSWRGYRSASGGTSTAAFSVTSYPSVSNLQKATMTLGGTADGRLCLLDQQFHNTNFAAGDTIVFEVEVDWNISTANIYGIFAALNFQNVSFTLLASSYDGFYQVNSAYGVYPTGTGSVVLRTDPFVAPAATYYLDPQVGVVLANDASAVNAVVNVARASLRKVGV